MAKPLSHHEAMIYAMVTVSAVDRAMTDAEFGRIGEIVSHLPVFAEYDKERLIETAQGCGEILSADGGLHNILDIIRKALPKKLHETAYAVALEVAAADQEVTAEETRFLELLSEALEIDRLTRAAIERGVRARNMVL